MTPKKSHTFSNIVSREVQASVARKKQYLRAERQLSLPTRALQTVRHTPRRRHTLHHVEPFTPRQIPWSNYDDAGIDVSSMNASVTAPFVTSPTACGYTDDTEGAEETLSEHMNVSQARNNGAWCPLVQQWNFRHVHGEKQEPYNLATRLSPNIAEQFTSSPPGCCVIQPQKLCNFSDVVGIGDPGASVSAADGHAYGRSFAPLQSPDDERQQDIQQLVKQNVHLAREVKRLEDDVSAAIRNEERFKKSLIEAMEKKHERRVQQLKESFEIHLEDVRRRNKEEIELMSEKIRSVQEKTASMEADVQTATELYKSEESKTAALLDKNKQLEEQIAAALKTVTQFSEKNATLAATLDTLRQTVAEKNATIDRLNGCVRRMSLDVEAARSMYQAQQDELARLSLRVSEATYLKEDLQQTLRHCEAKTVKLRQTIAAVEKSVAIAEGELEGKQRDHQQIVEEHKALAEKCVVAREKMEEYQKHTQESTRDSATLKQDNAALQERLRREEKSLCYYRDLAIRRYEQRECSVRPSERVIISCKLPALSVSSEQHGCLVNELETLSQERPEEAISSPQNTTTPSPLIAMTSNKHSNLSTVSSPQNHEPRNNFGAELLQSHLLYSKNTEDWPKLNGDGQLHNHRESIGSPKPRRHMHVRHMVSGPQPLVHHQVNSSKPSRQKPVIQHGTSLCPFETSSHGHDNASDAISPPLARLVKVPLETGGCRYELQHCSVGLALATCDSV